MMREIINQIIDGPRVKISREERDVLRSQLRVKNEPIKEVLDGIINGKKIDAGLQKIRSDRTNRILKRG